MKIYAGFGELLRYVTGLADQGPKKFIASWRLVIVLTNPPVSRAKEAGAETVTEITSRIYLTLGAII